jgi:hypothetical protein
MVGAYLKKRPAVVSETAPVTPAAKKPKSSHSKHTEETEQEGDQGSAPAHKASDRKVATPAIKAAVDLKTPKKQKK